MPKQMRASVFVAEKKINNSGKMTANCHKFAFSSRYNEKSVFFTNNNFISLRYSSCMCMLCCSEIGFLGGRLNPEFRPLPPSHLIFVSYILAIILLTFYRISILPIQLYIIQLLPKIIAALTKTIFQYAF